MGPDWGRADTAAPNLSHPGDRAKWEPFPWPAGYRALDGDRRRAPARRAPAARRQEGRHGPRAPADERPHVVPPAASPPRGGPARRRCGRSASACRGTAGSRCRWSRSSWSTRAPGRCSWTRASIPRRDGTARGVRARRERGDQGRDTWSRARPCPPSCASSASSRPRSAYVVMTHLHSDHASGISEFPESTFVVSDRRVGGGRLGRPHARATGAASSTTPSTGGRWTSSRRTRTRSPPSAARSTSSATAACGSCPRPGHTAGHLSVILRLSDREALLTGDAAYTRAHDRARPPLPYRMEDEHRFRRSLREIQLYSREQPGRARDHRPRHGPVARLAPYYE